MSTQDRDSVQISRSGAFENERRSAHSSPDADTTPGVLERSSHSTISADESGETQTLEELQKEILSAFNGEFEPVQVSPGYRLGIAMVTVVMILLPLLYVAIIGLVGYGVYYHTIHHTEILTWGTGRGKFGALLLYLAPMIAGGILVLFMFKPLFSRPARRPPTRSVSREEEPLLFAFVERICKAVRAPIPKRIDLDCEVNASASFRRGLISMLGNDLVLTIGMPLIAGLSLRQLAGVLAHEFGHFAQGAGMRLTYIIRVISLWFTRVVYERDMWDQRLENWASGVDLRVGWVLHLARLFVWLTRKVLWCLMMIGHAVSGFMLRQMEFDADRYEARLAGSETFAKTARQLVVLNVANQGAQADLGEFYRDGRLGDDLPKLIVANVSQLPDETHTKIDEHINNSTTGLLDTHPADRDRIASARRENAAGIFHLEQPATILFRDFAAQSRNVTWEFYRMIFGNKLRREEIFSVDELLSRQGREQESLKALHRYFQGSYNPLRPQPVPKWPLDAPSDPDLVKTRLQRAREQMLETLPQYNAASAEYDQADTKLLETAQASALLKAEFNVENDVFSEPLTSRAAIDLARSSAIEHQKELADDLEIFEQITTVRLTSALELLQLPEIATQVENLEEWKQECAKLLPVLSVVSSQIRPLLTLRNSQAALAILMQGWQQGNQEHGPLIVALRDQKRDIVQQIGELSEVLDTIRYPFDHAKGDISVTEYAVPEPPDESNPVAIYQAVDSLGNTIPVLTARMTGRLCVLAEEIETVLGLPPLPEPAVPDAEATSAET